MVNTWKLDEIVRHFFHLHRRSRRRTWPTTTSTTTKTTTTTTTTKKSRWYQIKRKWKNIKTREITPTGKPDTKHLCWRKGSVDEKRTEGKKEKKKESRDAKRKKEVAKEKKTWIKTIKISKFIRQTKDSPSQDIPLSHQSFTTHHHHHHHRHQAAAPRGVLELAGSRRIKPDVSHQRHRFVLRCQTRKAVPRGSGPRARAQTVRPILRLLLRMAAHCHRLLTKWRTELHH